MIVGRVNSQFEPQIGVFIEDSNGQEQTIDFAIDTGFTGYMSLPAATISKLGLARTQKRNVQLADGSVIALDVYTATLIWDSQSRMIEVYACNSAPVIGMKMLIGYEVKNRVIAGGPVWIDVVP